MISAVIFAFFLHFRSRLWGSRLVRGEYGVAVTYWLFAFLGSILVVGLAYLYLDYKINSMGAADSSHAVFQFFALMSVFSAPGIAAVVVFLYQITVVVSVWRATRRIGVSFWRRWLARYGILFNAILAGAVFSFAMVGLVLGVALYFAVWHFYLKKRSAKNGSHEASKALPDIDGVVSTSQQQRLGGGHIEIELADLSTGEPMLEQYVQCIRPTGELEARIHVWPNISGDKLKVAFNARQFKSGLVKQKTWLLIDDSRGLTGKEGLLVTDQMFDFKPATGEACSYSHKFGFNGFEAKGCAIFRMGEECISFRNISADAVERLVLLFNSYFVDHQLWCEKMALDGDREAQFKLSFYIKDKSESIVWLHKAAEQGHIIAQGNLGAYLESSNLKDSFHWLSCAAGQGHDLSMQRLSSVQYDAFR